MMLLVKMTVENVTDVCVCVALAAGDAPYCTPELYKECADPALGKKKALSTCGLNL